MLCEFAELAGTGASSRLTYLPRALVLLGCLLLGKAHLPHPTQCLIYAFVWCHCPLRHSMDHCSLLGPSMRSHEGRLVLKHFRVRSMPSC